MQRMTKGIVLGPKASIAFLLAMLGVLAGGGVWIILTIVTTGPVGTFFLALAGGFLMWLLAGLAGERPLEAMVPAIIILKNRRIAWNNLIQS